MYINELKTISHSARKKMDMLEDSFAKYGLSSINNLGIFDVLCFKI